MHSGTMFILACSRPAPSPHASPFPSHVTPRRADTVARHHARGPFPLNRAACKPCGVWDPFVLHTDRGPDSSAIRHLSRSFPNSAQAITHRNTPTPHPTHFYPEFSTIANPHPSAQQGKRSILPLPFPFISPQSRSSLHCPRSAYPTT